MGPWVVQVDDHEFSSKYYYVENILELELELERDKLPVRTEREIGLDWSEFQLQFGVFTLEWRKSNLPVNYGMSTYMPGEST